ncbi:MAG: hypothetical protein JWN87_2580 [Frankiales bacterium]|jgi:hypothetical protein|nr:hypothetical protein [Frankiales bacterium]MCW2586109.1 hypothetical protein [Frankiales bacterium]
MTSDAGPTYLQTLMDAEQANGLVMWQAANTVRSRVSDIEIQNELLGALGLLDVPRPAHLR